MLVTYAAPNRAHHYIYAAALARAGHLRRFVCGVSRFSPNPVPRELDDKFLRADHLQNVYLAGMKMRWPAALTEELAYLSKIWIDRCAREDARASDAFLFYNGAGLGTVRALKSSRTVSIVEAVNTHVLEQKYILEEEHDRLKLPLRGFPAREVSRRVKEYELADGIICPSRFARQSFIDRGFDPDRVRLVPFGINLSAMRAPAERPADVFRVLFVGQINVRKGLRYLFEAFEKLSHPKKELWIVGPRTAQTGIDDVTPPEGTRFPGALTGRQLEEAYRSSHVFVLPTLEEGMALVIGEALAHGLPVIATVNSGGADLIEEGLTGFLVPIRAPADIAAKLQLLADDRAILTRMSLAASASDRERRSWDVAGGQLVETLQAFTRMSKP